MAAGFNLGWRQVALCFLLLASATMIASTFSIVAVPLAREFQPSRMVLMLAMTAMSAVTALIAPLAGGLMDRVSLRRLMLLGSALLVAGHLTLSFATSFAQVLAIYGLLMAPASLLIGPIATSVLLSRWFVRQRGRALGIAMAGVSAGGVVFPLVIQGLLDAHEWREAFRMLALVLFFTTVPAVLLVVNQPADRGLRPDGAAAGTAGQDSRAPASVPPTSARLLLTDRTFWLVALMIGVMSAGMKGLVTNLAPIALDEGVPAEVAAFLVSAYAACSFVAKLGFAAIADRMPLRALMFVMVAGFGLGMACLTQADMGLLPIALGVGLVGVLGGATIPLQTLLISRIYGHRVVGRVMGILSSVLLVAALVTPPLFGLIFDRTGSYSAIFVVFVVLTLVTLAAIPRIRLQSRDETERSDAALARSG